jgi:hypothetical protein
MIETGLAQIPGKEGNPMRLAPTKAGFSPERLERITDHLTSHYVDPGKIAGCQTLVARRRMTPSSASSP